MTGRMLVAGIGNIFLGDDGFGVAVAGRLADAELPDWVQVADYGIAGMHLAYDLAEGYDTAILVDAMPRGEQPGTVYVLEVGPGPRPEGLVLDAHGMQPDVVLQMLDMIGASAGRPRRILVVGCEPASTEEGIGLSEPVTLAVDQAADIVMKLVRDAGQDRQPDTDSLPPTAAEAAKGA